MNDETLSLEEMLRANDELVRRQLSGPAQFELGFDEASVEWVDGFIDRQRIRTDLESTDGLVDTLGSFLGECMFRELGASWNRSENGQISVKFSDGNEAFPFNKVRKQFANGGDDSILGFYRSAAALFG